MMSKRRSIVDGSEAVGKYDIQDSDEAGEARTEGVGWGTVEAADGTRKWQCIRCQQQEQQQHLGSSARL
jgi:hypothetical protein